MHECMKSRLTALILLALALALGACAEDAVEVETNQVDPADLVAFSDVLRRDHGHVTAIRGRRVEPHVGSALGSGQIGLNAILV